MSVGYPINKANLDNIMGAEIGAVWTALEAIRLRAAWLADAAHGQTFMTSTIGYTVQEDTDLRAAFTDLDSLRQISHATGPKGVANLGAAAAANDFFFNAKKLGGTNWYG